MKKIYLTIIFGIALGYSALSQQQASYSQYMFNGMAINPAYIGTNDGLSFTGLSRWQWLGFEGAPVTQTFAVNAALPDKNAGFGLQFIRDEVSIVTNTSVMFGYAYKIGMAGGYLNFGVQGGFNTLATNETSLYIGNNPDQTFSNNTNSSSPNFGVGLFYYNPIFYVGASAPMLVNNTLEANGSELYQQERHFFFTSGVMFRLNESLSMKPNLLVTIVKGAPLSLDYNVNFLIKEIIWLGVSYRAPESINFLVEIKVNQAFRVGYAYDHIIDQTLSTQATSSHEIMLDYTIRWNKSRIVAPRYF